MPTWDTRSPAAMLAESGRTDKRTWRRPSVEAMNDPGRAIGREIAAGEAVEKELDAFISRRDNQRRKSEPERETEAAWVAAERRQEALRRREMDREHLEWHRRRLVRVHRGRMEHHEAVVERLTETQDERMSA